MKGNIREVFITLTLLFLLVTIAASSQNGGNYNLSWSTIDGGGGLLK